MGWSDLRRFFGRLIQALPQGQREALELNFFGQLSQREIALRTGIPPGHHQNPPGARPQKLSSMSAAHEAELR